MTEQDKPTENLQMNEQTNAYFRMVANLLRRLQAYRNGDHSDGADRHILQMRLLSRMVGNNHTHGPVE